MTRYLLDTNIVSNIVKQPGGTAARRSEALGSTLCTNIIILAELRFWLVKRPAAWRQARLDAVLGPIDVLPIEAPCDVIYGSLRAHLESAGTMIGPNDLLIAAHAMALGLTVVTDNEREFRRVPGLSVENWLRA